MDFSVAPARRQREKPPFLNTTTTTTTGTDWDPARSFAQPGSLLRHHHPHQPLAPSIRLHSDSMQQPSGVPAAASNTATLPAPTSPLPPLPSGLSPVIEGEGSIASSDYTSCRSSPAQVANHDVAGAVPPPPRPHLHPKRDPSSSPDFRALDDRSPRLAAPHGLASPVLADGSSKPRQRQRVLDLGRAEDEDRSDGSAGVPKWSTLYSSTVHQDYDRPFGLASSLPYHASPTSAVGGTGRRSTKAAKVTPTPKGSADGRPPSSSSSSSSSAHKKRAGAHKPQSPHQNQQPAKFSSGSPLLLSSGEMPSPSSPSNLSSARRGQDGAAAAAAERPDVDMIDGADTDSGRDKPAPTKPFTIKARSSSRAGHPQLRRDSSYHVDDDVLEEVLSAPPVPPPRSLARAGGARSGGAGRAAQAREAGRFVANDDEPDEEEEGDDDDGRDSVAGMEPAWSDGASFVDGTPFGGRGAFGHEAGQDADDMDEESDAEAMASSAAAAARRKARKQDEEASETFEMAALRRQVEQLQMALKRQMQANQQQRRSRPQQKDPSSPFMTLGIPTPPGSSRPDSFVSGPLGKGSVAPYSTDMTMVGEEPSNGRFVRPRVTSDPPTLSSVVLGESVSQVTRLSDRRVEELAQKIEALENLFRSASISPHPSDGSAVSVRPASMDLTSLAQAQQDGQQRALAPEQLRPYPYDIDEWRANSPSAAGPQRSRYMPTRSPSLSTISTRDGRGQFIVNNGTSTIGSSYTRNRSPAASAFHYNATPYSRGGPEAPMPAMSTSALPYPGRQGDKSFLSPLTPSSTQGAASNSSSEGHRSQQQSQQRKRGVARFIMSRKMSGQEAFHHDDVDRHPDPNIKTMQVSWSKKRMEKIEKPHTKVKTGPGRGRMVIQPKT